MPKKRKPGALYFTGISRVDKGGVVLTGNYYTLEESPEQRIALLSLKDGIWGSVDLAGIAHAVRHSSGATGSKKEYLVLERNRGLYRINPPGNVRFERIGAEREGFLTDLRKIGDKWYAVGGHHQAYQETRGGGWKAIDEQIYVDGEKGDASVLLSVHGLSESDIYSVGFNGVIFHYNGKVWNQLPSPTNAGLQRVLCVDKDEVYICGNANGLYRGTGSKWTELTESDESVTFWDMALFQGKVYLCTKTRLFVVQDDTLQEVAIPVRGPLGFYRMDADRNELWTCGNECVLQFDGRKWKQYVFPDNS
jgi:hypothetical protein